MPRLGTLDEVTLAEAAAWLVRLQGEGRTEAVEAAFKSWLADPAHARAFAQVTDTWDVIPGGARLLERRIVTSSSSRKRRWEPALLAACLALVTVLGVGVAWLTRAPAYQTGLGEQQTVALADGTRLTLNTDSRIEVDYSQGERRVRLRRGEALFEVKKDPSRPFVVQAGNEEVRALGTSFVVRREGDKVAVVLLEGKVAVTRRVESRAPERAVATLSPGERLTVVQGDAGAATTTMDRPRLDVAMAWRRGEVIFDDVSLADACAELSRYGETPVEVHDPRLSALRVSGVFATRDPSAAAALLAQLHGLRAEIGEGRIVLQR